MTTVTGLTAERMLAIEAASVVDGDVVGDDLILVTKGGTQINAGDVRGPQGEPGPVGSDLKILESKPILDVGLPGQIRAGRQLTPDDFTNMGLSVPIGLWNLSDLNDSSGNGRNLINKGAVPFGIGINGLPTTAVKFNGSTSQALYISDTGVNDPFRIKTGSLGCWFRTSKRGVTQTFISKNSAVTGNYSYAIYTLSTNVAGLRISGMGNSTTTPGVDGFIDGTSDVSDDRWHFIVCTIDGTSIRLYVDGILERQDNVNIIPFSSNGPLTIGAFGSDGATNGSLPNYGFVDEAFITNNVLSESHVRNLYFTKISHTLGQVPSRLNLNVYRRHRGAALTVADFPSQPARLYNFSAGSLGDEGSNNQILINNGGAISVAGVDGSVGNAFSFVGAQSLSSTDAGLPSGTASRSYGLWVKTNSNSVSVVIGGWGTTNTGDARLYITSAGIIQAYSGADSINGPLINDGYWHFVVVVENNAPTDGAKRKFYVDGRLVGDSTTLNPITLAGANRFRIAANLDGNLNMPGQIDSVFVYAGALTFEQILILYNKSSQILAPSPKNVGDHVEGMTDTDILATFDTLETRYQIDLSVAP